MSLFTRYLAVLSLALNVAAATSPNMAREMMMRGSWAEAGEPLLKRTRLHKRARRGCSVSSSSSITPLTSKPAASSSAQVKTYAAPPAKTTATAEPSDSSGSSNAGGFLGGVNSGDATYFDVGLGACGWTNSNSDLIVSVSHFLFDSYPGYGGGNPNVNPVCGRHINAHWGGRSVTLKVVDRCTGCDLTSLDMSPAGFDTLGNPDLGRLHGMTWSWA